MRKIKYYVIATLVNYGLMWVAARAVEANHGSFLGATLDTQVLKEHPFLALGAAFLIAWMADGFGHLFDK